MVIQNNVSSLHAYNRVTTNNTQLKKSLEKLSSGFRINRAADDAAGLAISEKMRAQIREANRCVDNVTEGISLAKTADGAMEELTEILRSVRTLCVQGANGVYEDVDREMINMEVRAKLEEIERICSYSNFNGIPLFEGKIRTYITETVTKLPDGFLANWGSIGGMPSIQSFDNAPPAVPAKLTLELDNVNSASDLKGRVFTFRNYNGGTYKIGFYNNDTSPASQIPPDCSYTVPVKASESVGAVINKISGSTYGMIKASYQAGPPETVEFEGPLLSKLQTIGNPVYAQNVPKADGTTGNSMYVECVAEVPTLPPIDNINTSYGNEKTAYYDLTMKDLTSTDIDNLVKNSISIASSTANPNSGVQIKFQKGSTPPPAANTVVLNDTGSMTKQQLVNAFTAIGSVTSGSYTVSFSDNGNGSVHVKCDITGSSPSTFVNSDKNIFERYPSGPVSQTNVNAVAASVGMSTVNPGGAESFAEFQFTLNAASIDVSSKPKSFTINVGGSSYSLMLYDSSVAYDAGTLYSYGGVNNRMDIRGKSLNEVTQMISNYVGFSGYTETVSGNTITFKHQTVGAATASATGTTSGYLIYQTSSGGGGSAVLLNSQQYLKMDDAKISFDLSSALSGGVLDPSRLDGKGFSIGSQEYYFSDGTTTMPSGYSKIDISGCTSLGDIKTKYPALAGLPLEVTANGIQLVSKPRTTYSGPFSAVTNGVQGSKPLFAVGKENLSGGEDIGVSFAEIDFSQISVSSLENKGFRVTCGTCPSEYINVIFSNLAKDIPPTFEIIDPATGEKRTIRNVVINPTSAKTPADLVQAIVTQSQSQLKHFTGFRVSDTDPAVLVAEERRWGNLVDAAGNTVKGEVLSGVYSNFTVDLEEIEEHLDTSVKIYVGSHPTHQWIDIRLPALSLENLKLDDPEFDLTDEVMADYWMRRTGDALETVTAKRALVGADTNRLECAFSQLSNSATQITESESRLRDMDMAKGMMDQVKSSILVQGAQAMLAQSNNLPKNVLQMLS